MVDQPVGTDQCREGSRDEAVDTPRGFDVGRLGRRRRARPHQPAHPREGPRRRAEVEAGISFCLSLPLDFPGGTALNQRRYPPRLAPTEDMDGHPEVFYNVHMSEMPDFGRPEATSTCGPTTSSRSRCSTRRSGTRSPTSARSSTPTATASRRPSTTTATAPASTSSGRRRRAGDGGGHLCFAHHLGLEHMASTACRAAACSSTSRTTSATTGEGSTCDAAGDHGGRQRRGGAGRHAPAPHRLRHQGARVGPESRPPEEIHRCARTSTRDESLLEWIAESQISALVADNYAVEGARQDRDPSRHAFLPIHHLCLFKLGVPLGELWYLARARHLAARARPQPLPAHRAPLRLPGIVGSPLTPIATV